MTVEAQDPQKTDTTASSLTQEERERIASMSYEEARDQLIQAVQALEAGGLNLDQSMRQWELGEALAKRAQTLLDQVRAKLYKAMGLFYEKYDPESALEVFTRACELNKQIGVKKNIEQLQRRIAKEAAGA